jgi:hypothetical protein
MTCFHTLLAAAALAGLSACTTGTAGLTHLEPVPATGLRDANAMEVERFFMEGIGRFNRRELDAFLTQFDESIRMFAVSSWLRGKAQVRQRFVETYRQFPDARMDITNLRARSETPTVVTVEFEFHTYPRGTGPAYHGVGTGVYVRRAEGWREVLEHESVTRRDPGLQAPPAPRPTASRSAPGPA